jgi:CBS domain-containing protein
MLEQKNARDIMVNRLITLKPEDDVLDACDRLIENHITGAPVMDPQRRFLGLFSEKCAMGLANLIVSRDGTDYPCASDVMQTRLVTVRSDADVFDAIGELLKSRVSGAPVVDAEGRLLGTFSEKTSMSVVVDAAYDGLPTTTVKAFLDPDPHRIIDPETPLPALVAIFQSTPFRRLVVVDNGELVGLVSRRDVIRAVTPILRQHASTLMRGLEHTLTDGTIQDTPVSTFMDRNARTIDPDTDPLSIAQIFLTTNYRRLPVLEDRKVIGQISRRDLLAVMLKSLAPKVHITVEPLMLDPLHPERRPI